MRTIIKIVVLVCALAGLGLCRSHQSGNHETRFGSQDPEIWMNATQIIQRWGYTAESHNVTTSDGYIMNIQRIPFGKDQEGQNCVRPVVFFQHGLESSSTNWITNLPSQSAAYIFADAGFDVWLGNFRGNTYGKNHMNLTTEDKRFWDFSWDEMAAYDLPAMINYVLHVTNQRQLYYIGHSEGTMTAFAAFSQDQQLASKIKHYYALAPIASMKHQSSYVFQFISKFTGFLNFLYNVAGVGEFIPNSWLMDEVAKYICYGYTSPICDDMMFLMAGADSHQLNLTRIPVYVSHSPAGTSTKNIVHFGQLVNSGLFDKYNYGKEGNQQHYGMDKPPVYDLTQMKVPVSLYWGDMDILADPQDVTNSLLPYLPNVVHNEELSGFNHIDFIWGMRAHIMVYHPIVNGITRMEKDTMKWEDQILVHPTTYSQYFDTSI